MSFSFSVPAGPAKDFSDTAANAKQTLETASEGNDYALTQLASGLADEAIKAAQSIIDSGKLGDGNVSASLSGHYANDGRSSSTVSVSLSCTPLAPPA